MAKEFFGSLESPLHPWMDALSSKELEESMALLLVILYQSLNSALWWIFALIIEILVSLKASKAAESINNTESTQQILHDEIFAGKRWERLGSAGKFLPENPGFADVAHFNLQGNTSMHAFIISGPYFVLVEYRVESMSPGFFTREHAPRGAAVTRSQTQNDEFEEDPMEDDHTTPFYPYGTDPYCLFDVTDAELEAEDGGSSESDNNLYESSEPEREDWQDEIDTEKDWDMKIVGVEVANGDEIYYEARWPGWSRSDGTTNTYHHKNDPSIKVLTCDWDNARQNKIKNLIGKVKKSNDDTALGIEIWPDNDVILYTKKRRVRRSSHLHILKVSDTV
ncbi:hypothetical protein F5876DRAFT_70963, partial [Lentinula aff. lateritia]